jgi:hypothetical protein
VTSLSAETAFLLPFASVLVFYRRRSSAATGLPGEFCTARDQIKLAAEFSP